MLCLYIHIKYKFSKNKHLKNFQLEKMIKVVKIMEINGELIADIML